MKLVVHLIASLSLCLHTFLYIIFKSPPQRTLMIIFPYVMFEPRGGIRDYCFTDVSNITTEVVTFPVCERQDALELGKALKEGPGAPRHVRRLYTCREAARLISAFLRNERTINRLVVNVKSHSRPDSWHGERSLYACVGCAAKAA